MESDDDVIDGRAARDRRGRVRRYVTVAAGAVALLIIGGAGGALWSERYGGVRARPAAPGRDGQTPAASPDGRPMPGMSGMSAPAGRAGAGQPPGAGRGTRRRHRPRDRGGRCAAAAFAAWPLGRARRQARDRAAGRLEITVASPADGLVIARSVNPGQVINAGQELFVVTDLSTVWIIGDLYERDFSRVRVGSPVTITLPSMPDRSVTGRVAYIDPRVDPATRTAKVRVEVPNRGGDLRLGMFVTMSIRTGTTERITVVPRAAVQTIGDRSVVYVPAEGEEGKFVERAVKVGPPAGEFVPILNGLKPGDKVVTDGSFYLRAEAARTRSGG